MNLVQRIVAENRQSVTSQELAEASGMVHLELRALIAEYRSKFEELGPVQEQNGGLILNIDQTFFAILLLPMSEEDEPTPSDELKAELKFSMIKLLRVVQRAATEREN